VDECYFGLDIGNKRKERLGLKSRLNFTQRG
jgi:hypothetical protein